MLFSSVFSFGGKLTVLKDIILISMAVVTGCVKDRWHKSGSWSKNALLACS